MVFTSSCISYRRNVMPMSLIIMKEKHSQMKMLIRCYIKYFIYNSNRK